MRNLVGFLFLIFFSVFAYYIVTHIGFNPATFSRHDLEKIALKFTTTTQEALHIEQKVIAPPPLKKELSPLGEEGDMISRALVIQHTNAERTTEGLQLLSENELLNRVAESKLQDMFNKQYFAHISPDGIGPGELVENIGYVALIAGENLAQGNFENTASLVRAWMESPGHRANILNERYREIGVAAQKGIYEGRYTWIAVQTFATPLSVCSSLDKILQQEIKTEEETLRALDARITELRVEIENMEEPKNRKEQDVYNNKVKEHNELVNDLNLRIQELKTKIEIYNNQVIAFNACVQRFSVAESS